MERRLISWPNGRPHSVRPPNQHILEVIIFGLSTVAQSPSLLPNPTLPRLDKSAAAYILYTTHIQLC